MSDDDKFDVSNETDEGLLMARLTNSLRGNGLGDHMEARCTDGWWYLVDRRLARQAVHRYQDPWVLDNMIWTRDARIWPLMVVEV